MIDTYEQFIQTVEELGVMAFAGSFLPRFPALQHLTEEDKWHTGDRDTDPWQWKDRAAAERRLAFGCLLGGHKGFISRELYPLFYAACKPRYTVNERFAEGTVNRAMLEVSRLFTPGVVLTTGEIRGKIGAAPKQGSAKVDAAVAALQREFTITVCGNRRKRNKKGEEYGWPANTYCLAEEWSPDWLADAGLPPAQEARERILDHCAARFSGIDRDKLYRRLFGKCA